MANIKTAANQKTITITNKPPCDKNHPYTITNLSVKFFAMKKLQSLAGYKIWEYLAANQENYTLALSQETLESTCGIKRAAYNSGIQELIDKKFLVLSDPKKSKTKYNFIPFPLSDEF